MKPEDVRILDSRLIVEGWQKPAQVGSLVVPEAWRRHNDRQFWRLVAWGEKAEAMLGEAAQPGALLVTPDGAGSRAEGLQAPGEDRLFWIWAEQVLAWIDETEEEEVTSCSS